MGRLLIVINHEQCNVFKITGLLNIKQILLVEGKPILQLDGDPNNNSYFFSKDTAGSLYAVNSFESPN
ncbi:hypothetical protein [Microseira wollei]|uniref:hypothetical protein n=1 Tax=Microseira wollei TaxID=467598 RepID=UPI001CFCC4AA|nr:hypothetical protein [Microseira wollei]